MEIKSTTSELENLLKTFSVLVAPIKGMSEKLQLAEMDLLSSVTTQAFSGAIDSSSTIGEKLKGIGKLPDPLSDQLKAVTEGLTNQLERSKPLKELFEALFSEVSTIKFVAPNASAGYIPSGINRSFNPQSCLDNIEFRQWTLNIEGCDRKGIYGTIKR